MICTIIDHYVNTLPTIKKEKIKKENAKYIPTGRAPIPFYKELLCSKKAGL